MDALPRILLSLATVAAAMGIAAGIIFYVVFEAPETIAGLFARDGLASLLGQVLGWMGVGSAGISILAIIVAAVRRSWDFIGPMWIDPSAYSTDPGYRDRLPFLDRFHVDFRTITRSFVGSHPVFVLIDDLDRCEASRVPELMHALNLMIAQEPHLFFIIAMDREKIAAAIATTYGETESRLAAPTEDSRTASLRFGYEYLEKFVQLSFPVPTPSRAALRSWLQSLSGEAAPSAATRAELEPRLQRLRIILGDDSAEIQELALMVAPFLGYNVRRMKQFLNQLRVRAYIADLTGLFHRNPIPVVADQQQELTLPRLAKLVTISMRWPEWIAIARDDRSVLEQLEEMALGHSDRLETFLDTAPPPALLELIGADLDKWPDYSLRDLDIERWLEVNPRQDPGSFVGTEEQETEGETADPEQSRRAHISSASLEVPPPPPSESSKAAAKPRQEVPKAARKKAAGKEKAKRPAKEQKRGPSTTTSEAKRITSWPQRENQKPLRRK